MEDKKVIVIGMGEGKTSLTIQQLATLLSEEMMITLEEAMVHLNKIPDVFSEASLSLKELGLQLRKLQDLSEIYIEEESNPYILRPKNNHHFQKINSKPKGNHRWKNFQHQSRSSI